MRITKDDYTLSTEPADQQPEQVHAYLTRSYWAEDIPLELVKRSIENSFCIGLFHQTRQIGLARVITDRATFAYLCDVYVLEEHRGRGLSKWMIETLMAQPPLQGLRRLMLFTRDAHSLYARYGFRPSEKPEALMEIRHPGLYKRNAQQP